MGYIYKITNLINHKAYIGKTHSCIFKRFSQHLIEATKERSRHRPLYNAIRKYGSDKFILELIEITPEPEDREIFWIAYYDTYRNGYNATKGGDGRPYVNESVILQLHSEGLSVQIISEIAEHDPHTVLRILKNNQLVPNQHKHRAKKNAVRCVETGQIFESQKAVANFLKPGCDRAERASIASKVSLCCRKRRKTAYGFSWEYIIPH